MEAVGSLLQDKRLLPVKDFPRDLLPTVRREAVHHQTLPSRRLQESAVDLVWCKDVRARLGGIGPAASRPGVGIDDIRVAHGGDRIGDKIDRAARGGFSLLEYLRMGL